MASRVGGTSAECYRKNKSFVDRRVGQSVKMERESTLYVRSCLSTNNKDPDKIVADAGRS